MPGVPLPEQESQDMVSLFEAATLAYFNTTGQYTVSHATLNQLAGLIARRTRLFTRSSEARDHALVMPGEIEEGDFKLGGAYLEFPDARPPLGNLTILRRELAPVLHEIGELVKRGALANV